LSDVFPPDSAPRGKEPVGVKPFNWRTLSLSSLKGKKQQFVSFWFSHECEQGICSSGVWRCVTGYLTPNILRHVNVETRFLCSETIVLSPHVGRHQWWGLTFKKKNTSTRSQYLPKSEYSTCNVVPPLHSAWKNGVFVRNSQKN
jgi:hypothetical protein